MKNPLTLVVGLVFLSFLVPIIEEIAKSLGVWLVADRLAFPAQGFALGVLAGAGLFEIFRRRGTGAATGGPTPHAAS